MKHKDETCRNCGGTGWVEWRKTRETPVRSKTGAIVDYKTEVTVTNQKCGACR